MRPSTIASNEGVTRRNQGSGPSSTLLASDVRGRARAGGGRRPEAWAAPRQGQPGTQPVIATGATGVPTGDLVPCQPPRCHMTAVHPRGKELLCVRYAAEPGRPLRRPIGRRSARSTSRSQRRSSVDLRRRVSATRWPDRETDPSQGVRLETIQALARYWATDYDWRAFEERFAALPHFITEIDGVDIHFIHVRSKHERRAAADRHARLARLDDRAAQDHRAAHGSDDPRRQRGGRLPSRHPVVAGPRVLRKADGDGLGPDPHRARLGRADAAPRIQRSTWHKAATGETPSPSSSPC